MNIALRERITDNFKIEIFSSMVNISHKFAIYNTNVKIKNIPVVTACTCSQ